MENWETERTETKWKKNVLTAVAVVYEVEGKTNTEINVQLSRLFVKINLSIRIMVIGITTPTLLRSLLLTLYWLFTFFWIAIILIQLIFEAELLIMNYKYK